MTGEGVHWSCASADSSACSRAHNNKALRIKIKKRGEGRKERAGSQMVRWNKLVIPAFAKRRRNKKKERESSKPVWVTWDPASTHTLVSPGTAAHTCNPSPWKAEAGGSEVESWLRLHTEFKASQLALYKTLFQQNKTGKPASGFREQAH